MRVGGIPRQYRLSHLVRDLGWVYCDFVASTEAEANGNLAEMAGQWNIIGTYELKSTQSSPGLGARTRSDTLNYLTFPAFAEAPLPFSLLPPPFVLFSCRVRKWQKL